MPMSKRKARSHKTDLQEEQEAASTAKRAATELPEARGEWKAFFYLSTLRRREENDGDEDDDGSEDSDCLIPATEPFDEEADRSKLKRARAPELRAELKKRGVDDATGDKAALVERLLSLRAHAAAQAEADRSRDAWWSGETLLGCIPGGNKSTDPASLPSVTFTADGQAGTIHAGTATNLTPPLAPTLTLPLNPSPSPTLTLTSGVVAGTSELDHLEGALRRVSPPTTDGVYSDPWCQTRYDPDGRVLGGSMGTRLSQRRKPICAYEWRPPGDTA